MRKFEALLAKPRLTRAEAPNPAFECAFCRPRSGPLRQRWEERRARRAQHDRAEGSPAAALLLSYQPEFGGSLWLLEATTNGRRTDAELGALARRALRRATLLVSRELPALVEVPHDAEAWSIRRIVTGGEAVLDGESFGLSLCLAAAARCLGLPSPTHLAATASVSSDGAVFEVGGLREKLRVLHEWALGVETVLVARTQVDAAQAIAREIGACWTIEGVRSVTEAMTSTFPDLWTDLETRWSQPTTAAQVAGDLLRLARDGSNQVLSWRGIAEAAERVGATLPEGSVAAKDARFAALVARRHDGHDALLELDEPYLATMRRPLRLRCLAHVVQSHGDCAEELDPRLERAVLRTLPGDSRDDSPDDLRLLGALGRTWAAFFRYREAESVLRRAVQGWFELDLVPSASHALSELLRVLAVTDQHDGFGRALESYAERFLRDPRTAAVSRGFVTYSVGRGHTLLGEHDEARQRLSDEGCDWSLLPDHLRALRLRWLLRAFHVSHGDPVLDGAIQQLQTIVQRAPSLQVAVALAQLDRAEQSGEGLDIALQAFAQAKPLDYRRFVTTYGTGLGHRLAREYRY